MMIGRDFYATRPGPYKARSASDKTDDWPLWYIHGKDGVNCVRFVENPHALFMSREKAEAIAQALNQPSNGA